MKRYLSLGAGVQSSTLLLMSCRGDLPKLDGAIMANPRWEPKAVYQHLAWLRGEADAAGIPVHIVSRGNIREDMLRRASEGGKTHGGTQRFATMPFFIRQDGTHYGPDTLGMSRRQCTKEYKLEMIRKTLRRLVGLAKGARAPADLLVEQWIGISVDELRRVRTSADRWIQFAYPLIYSFTPPMRRSDCQTWLKQHYPDRDVPRSACIGCPYHSNAEWREMRDTRPDEWADAVDFDRQIRHSPGMRGESFLHVQRVPLDQAFLDDPDPRQGTLWSKECLGMCGI